MFYYPYKSDKPDKKFYIITSNNKKIYFGSTGYSDFTINKNIEKKNNYIKRHEKNENWGKSGINTAGFWSRWYLWNLPTKESSYNDIKKNFLS